MTGYIYDTASREILAVLTATDQSKIERHANQECILDDEFALTFTPAFGTADGLIMAEGSEEIDLDAIERAALAAETTEAAQDHGSIDSGNQKSG